LLDRVTERRRAAQLARHYRDQEGLAIAEIARRLGRAEATIKTYLYDPTGDKARQVKARYRGVCRGCGAPTAPRNGRATPTRIANAAIPAPSRRNGHGNGSAKQCEHGERATALRRPHTTGPHPRTPARRPSAQTTTSRRMASAVHGHRSVRGLGQGPRRRLRWRERLGLKCRFMGTRACTWSCVSRSAEDRRKCFCHSPFPGVAVSQTPASTDCCSCGKAGPSR
jgi:hypothetical protein